MLLFDLTSIQAIANVKRHGGGIYGEIVFRRLIERGESFCCYFDSNRLINPEIVTLCRANNIELHDINKIHLKNIIENNNISTIYSPLVGNGLADLSCRKIITIHGLRIFEMPKDKFQFSYRYKMSRMIKEILISYLPSIFLKRKRKEYVLNYFSDPNTEIVTVSNHSKNALITFFPEIKYNNIKLHTLYSPSTTRQNLNIDDTPQKNPYFLIVSGNRWVKNTIRAIIAFERLKSIGYLENIDLIITGAYRNDIKYKINFPKSIIFKGYVEDNELEALYKNAQLLVYPSLNEGFGYPPLEAMKYGIPVIASAITSIPEVCGEAAMYFNPFSIEEIMNRMLQMQDISVRNEYSNKSFIRYTEITKKQKEDLDKLIDLIIKSNL